MPGIGLTDYVYVLGNAGPIVLNGGGQGGWVSFPDIAARDAIIGTEFAYAGMVAYSIADDTYFRLLADETTWQTLVFGGGGSGNAVFATGCAALSGTDNTTFNDGTLAFVQTVRDFFVNNKNDTTTPANGITVLTAFDGSRWFRQNNPDVSWSLQADWEIDYAGGDDENTGAPGDPIKTRAELSRRLGSNPTRQNTTVTYLSAHTENVVLDIVVGSGFTYKELGTTPSVAYSGTITSYSAAIPGMNFHDQIIDASIGSWAPYLGKRAMLTSGANAGAFADIGYDLQFGGGVITTPWRKPTTNGGLDGTDRPPSPGDDYEIQDLTQVAYSAIASNADPVSSTGAISVQIQNINWKQASLNATEVRPNGGFSAVGCRITDIPFISSYTRNVLTSVDNGIYMNPASGIEIYCGLVSGLYGLNVGPNSTAYVYGTPLFNAYADIYVQNSSVLEVNGLAVQRATAGFVGSSGSHICLEQGSSVLFPQKYSGPGDLFYGDVATRRAITNRGGTVTYKTNGAQTTKGSLSGGDVEFYTNDNGLPADDSTGTYGAPYQMTWGNISANLNAHSIQTNGHIFRTS